MCSIAATLRGDAPAQLRRYVRAARAQSCGGGGRAVCVAGRRLRERRGLLTALCVMFTREKCFTTPLDSFNVRGVFLVSRDVIFIFSFLNFCTLFPVYAYYAASRFKYRTTKTTKRDRRDRYIRAAAL